MTDSLIPQLTARFDELSQRLPGGYDDEDHFRGVTKMVKLGSGAEWPVDDYMLTRYACYLIAQNGDPRKQAIAFAHAPSARRWVSAAYSLKSYQRKKTLKNWSAA